MTARAFIWPAALFLGALAPAILIAGLMGTARLLPLALMVTAAHAVVLGVPVTLLYRRKGWARPTASIVGGFLIGAVPTALMLQLFTPIFSSVDDVPLIVDSARTSAGGGAISEAS
jgi:RsiW-degrading membrane proteinase PrsW (M82 family)